jgi:peptide/nickel transport system permease protein
MLSYTARRLLQIIPVLIGITLFSFLLINLVPGDPVRIELGPHASFAQVEHLREQLGLNESLINQYLHFLGGAATLDFGESLALHQGVGTLISARIGPTAFLVLYSLVLSLLITVPFGVLAAVRREGVTDHAIRIVAMVFLGMPMFWLGLVLVLIFGLDLGWFPTGGYQHGFPEAIRSLTLPAITLALGIAPLFVRSLRASVIEILDTGFVEAARSRGYSQSRVLFRHVLRNASISTTTLVGVSVAGLLSWIVVIENVFSIPGLGQLLVQSVSARDYPVIQAVTVILALAVVLINLATDLVYAAIDPRVRYE